MGNIENNIFDIDITNIKTVEKKLQNKEINKESTDYTAFNVEKVSNSFKDNFGNVETSLEFSKNININILAGLKGTGFKIDDWSKKEGIKLEVA